MKTDEKNEQKFEDTDLSSNMEDYVESIETLSRKKKIVRVKDIARDLKIKMPSVTSALQKLEVKGLINYERYGFIDLTNKGKKIAEKVYSRHKFLSEFFNEVLKIDRKRADEVGCKIEHYLTAESCRQIYKLLEFYKTERKNNAEWTHELDSLLEQRPLGELQEGDTGIITGIQDSPLKKRLGEMGFRKGEKIKIIKYAPLKDPIELRIKEYNISLRIKEANTITVRIVLNDRDNYE
jgi:DtxR family transcriptional regulator, Mn-dependent transcriptional regulator